MKEFIYGENWLNASKLKLFLTVPKEYKSTDITADEILKVTIDLLKEYEVKFKSGYVKKRGYSEDEIIWKEAPSKHREAMIQNGDVDMILATYSITDERKKAVSFAGPYFVAGQDLLVRKDDNSINGPEDLNGKRLCSVTGSTSAATVKEKFASEVQLMEQPGYAECATALFSGIVDAVTTDDIILAGLASASRGKLKGLNAFKTKFTETITPVAPARDLRGSRPRIRP